MPFYVESKSTESWMVPFKGQRKRQEVKRGDIIAFDTESDAHWFCLNGKARMLTAAEAHAHENPKTKAVKSVVDLVTKDEQPETEDGEAVPVKRKGRKAAASED